MANGSRCSTLEEIQGDGDRLPLFCMPAADGLTLVYHELADRLGPNQPVYGAQFPWCVRRTGRRTAIEEMATRFIEDMREIRPHGPYLLLGYCSGGTVAFEVAQQLVAAGEKVAFVCGIETYDWSTSPATNKTLWVKTDYEIQRAGVSLPELSAPGSPRKTLVLAVKSPQVKSRIRVWRGMFGGLFGQKKRQLA